MVEAFLAWRSATRYELTEVGTEVDVDGVVAAPDGQEPGVRVRGRVDRLERDAEGRLVVVDVKTGKSPVTKDDAQRHAQLAFYQLAIAEGVLGEDDKPGGGRLVYIGKHERLRRHRTRAVRADRRQPHRVAADGARRGRGNRGPAVRGEGQRRLLTLPDAVRLPRPQRATNGAVMTYSPTELAEALGLPTPTDEQAAVICAPPGPLVVIAGAGAGKTETMAARVVWLVANGFAEPGQVLGLTFTRKAAGQLLRRVRSRLARLAGHLGAPHAAGAPTVSTYHAFAGTLLREYGLLLPVEPDARLLSETELWQLAYRRGARPTPAHWTPTRTPPAVTAMVLRLAGELAEHLVDTDQLRDTHVELERLVHTLPAGRYQRDRGPSQWLLNMLATQTERTALVPLIDAVHARMRGREGDGLRHRRCPRPRGWPPTARRSATQLRQRYRVVLLDEYQDTGHAQRIALSSLFGRGVDDGLALTAVGDPIQSIYGWRGASATNLPRFTTDFPQADGIAGADPGTAHQLAQSARARCTWPTRCPPRPAVGRSRCGRCGRGPAPNRAPSGARC